MNENAKVYVMRAPDGSVKIGHSISPKRRRGQIGDAVTLEHETAILVQAERIERLAHRVLALHGKHLKGEWFKATVEDAILAIEIAIRQAEGEELALGGRMPAPTAPGEMPHIKDTVILPVRVHKDVVAQLDKIAASFGLNELGNPKVNRSELVRRYILAGLERDEIAVRRPRQLARDTLKEFE